MSYHLALTRFFTRTGTDFARKRYGCHNVVTANVVRNGGFWLKVQGAVSFVAKCG